MARAEKNISAGGANVNAHEREIERLNRLYAALSELNQIIVRVKSREELFREVCRITTAKAGFKVAWVGWPDPQTHLFIPIARDGDKQDYLDEIMVYADDRPEGRGPTGTSIREDKLCVVNDFAGDPCMVPWHEAAAARGLRAVASLPIRFQGEVWGALTIYDSEPKVFQDKEIALLEEAAAAISFALESLNRELQRKQAEEALQRSEERLRLAQQVARVGTFESNIRTGLDTWTPELEALYGLSPGGFPKTESAWENLVYPDDRAAAIRRREQTLETGQPVEGEWRVVWPDGSVHWLAGRWQAFKDEAGKPLRLIGVNIDITERKRAEEALRASTERYELAVRGAGVGIWDWDIRTGKLYYSPRWKMLFGYDENDIGNSLEDWARLLHPDERDWILKFQDEFLAGTSPTVTVEYRLRHKDGSYRWIVVHALAVRDEQGKACRLVGSHGDITDRKQAEEALERERQSLWRMLQASDHERQVISYEIHDGLAQYLAAATMQFQAHDTLRENSPQEARKAYETAMELVRQAHSESRRLISEVRPPIIDENGIEMAISHLVHEQRRHGGPKIECHSDVQFGRLPSILENAIYRIVQEALTNACKHSKSEKVTVSMTQEGQDVRLEVRDWGIGFDPESVVEGHFGLEGIRQRVRLLGGRLTIETAPGSGALIRVVVPILERQNDR